MGERREDAFRCRAERITALALSSIVINFLLRMPRFSL